MSQQLPMLFPSAHADSEDIERIKDPARQMPFLEDPADPDWIFLPRSFLADMPHCQPVFENNAVDQPTRCRPVPAPRRQACMRQSIVSPLPAVPDAFNPEDCYPDQLNSLNTRYPNEPQPTLPTFNGKFGEWDAFWLQFQLLSDRYGWTGRKLADQLLLSLRDEALMFVASLPSSHRQTSVQLTRVLQERFSHNATIEAYRADLSHIQKNSTENLQEYASRVQALMTKAYPDISNTPTYEELLIQHFMRGLPDQDTAYEIRVKQPKTLTEAVNYIKWHEYCTGATRRPTLRNLQLDHTERANSNQEMSEEEVEPDVRSYITEERLQLLAGYIKKINLLAPPEEDPDSDKPIAAELLPGYSTEEIAKLQRQDQDIGIIHLWFDQQNMPGQAVNEYKLDANTIVCQHGILFQRRIIAPGKFRYQLLVPYILRVEVMRMNHIQDTRHCGINKTSRMIREKFVWHLMKDDIRHYVKHCSVCNSMMLLKTIGCAILKGNSEDKPKSLNQPTKMLGDANQSGVLTRPDESQTRRGANRSSTDDRVSMFRDDATRRDLSSRLSRILEGIGINERVITTSQQSCLREEKLLNFNLSFPGLRFPEHSCYYFGSQVERSTTEGLHSDNDGLMCMDNVYVIQSANELQPEKITRPGLITYLIHQGRDIPAGYCHLQCLTICVPDAHIIFKKHIRDSKGRLILSNIYSYVDGYRWMGTIQGPAITYKNRPNTGTLSLDFVTAYKCESISHQVLSWIQRSRNKHWPTADMLRTAEETGFFLVPVGHRLSENRDFEWRVSPSLTERTLMMGMNMTQLRCYIVLKMIKKDMITPNIGESVSSFHLKTILFFYIQNTTEEEWREDNLWNCIRLCLVRLSTCLQRKSCPNFLIPDENLFLGRIDGKQYLPLVILINDMIREGAKCLFKITCDMVGQKLQQTHIPAFINEHHTLAFKRSCARPNTQLVRGPSSFAPLLLRDEILALNKDILVSSFTNEVQKHIVNLRDIQMYHQDGDIKSEATCTLMFLYSLYGSLIASPCIRDGTSITQRALSFLQQGVNSDLMSGRLKYASVLHCSGKFEEAAQLLEDIHKQYNSEYVQAVCHCLSFPGEMKPSFCERVCVCSTDQQKRMLMACHVVFTQHEIPCCPPALIFEMFRVVGDEGKIAVTAIDDWFDHAVVDSVIFLHFLLFLTYKRLGLISKRKCALENLMKCFNHELFYLNHLVVAAYIIGQCFEMEDYMVGAFDFYTMSLQMSPMNNAARWLLALLVYKEMCKQNF